MFSNDILNEYFNKYLEKYELQDDDYGFQRVFQLWMKYKKAYLAWYTFFHISQCKFIKCIARKIIKIMPKVYSLIARESESLQVMV